MVWVQVASMLFVLEDHPMMTKKQTAIFLLVTMIVSACATTPTPKKNAASKKKRATPIKSEEPLSYSLADDLSIDPGIIHRGKRARGGY